MAVATHEVRFVYAFARECRGLIGAFRSDVASSNPLHQLHQLSTRSAATDSCASMRAEQYNATPTPQHRRDSPTSLCKIQSRSTVCFLVLILGGAAFGGFLFVRTVIQPCGCPEPCDDCGDGPSCSCEGGVFSCTYQCGSNRCYSNGEMVSCNDEGSGNPDNGSSNPDDEGGNNPADQGGPGTVNCPGASSYCSCQEDCDNDQDPYADNDYCTCAEAQASACCGR